MPKPRKVYKIEIAEKAADFIQRQTEKLQRQLYNKIKSLSQDPQTKGEPIKSSPGLLKIRSGDYRIAYKIEENQVLVLVVRVGHRGDFYDYFSR